MPGLNTSRIIRINKVDNVKAVKAPQRIIAFLLLLNPDFEIGFDYFFRPMNLMTEPVPLWKSPSFNSITLSSSM